MLATIEERMKQNDETSATQLRKMLGQRDFKISMRSVKRARKTLGWTFHSSRHCQFIRNTNKENRVQWAKDNLHSSFDGAVWTDKSTFQLENNQMFLYQKVGFAPAETSGKAPIQSHDVHQNIKEGSHEYLPHELLRE